MLTNSLTYTYVFSLVHLVFEPLTIVSKHAASAGFVSNLSSYDGSMCSMIKSCLRHNFRMFFMYMSSEFFFMYMSSWVWERNFWVVLILSTKMVILQWSYVFSGQFWVTTFKRVERCVKSKLCKRTRVKHNLTGKFLRNVCFTSLRYSIKSWLQHNFRVFFVYISSKMFGTGIF